MRIVIGCIILIAILAGAGTAAIYFTEASIYYSLDVYRYEKTDGKWYSRLGTNRFEGTLSNVHLENKGSFDGTFRLIIRLTNASFYNNSFPVYSFGSGEETSISFTLKPHQEIDQNFTFNITGIHFIISIDLQSDQLLLRSTVGNLGDQNTFFYGPRGNTWVPPLVSG